MAIRAALASMVAGAMMIVASASAYGTPPRTVSDLMALLGNYKPDVRAVTALKASLDQHPPADDSRKSVLIEYWRERARAAQQLGLFSIEREARRKLAVVSQNGPEHVLFAYQLAATEIWFGNYAEGLRMTEEQVHTAASAIYRGATRGRMAWLLARQGDVGGADQYFKLAQADFDQAVAMRLTSERGAAAPLEATRGMLFATRGRLPDAELALRKAIEHFSGLDIPANALNLPILQLAGVLVQQSRYVDAEVLLRERLIELLKRHTPSSPITVSIVDGLTAVYAEQGRFDDAAALASAALRGVLNAGTPAESGYVLDLRLALARAHIGNERWRDAAVEFDLIRAAAQGAAAGHRAASGTPEIAVALVRSGDPALALEMMRTIAQRLEASLGPKHYRTGEARGVLAMALWRSGERDAALAAFREAIATMLEFEAQADGADSTGLRRLKLVWIIEAYLELLAERHRTGDAEAAKEAFRVADVARAQRVQRAVTSSAVRAAAGTPELADLARKEQDLGHEVASLYKFLGEQLLRPAEQQLPRVTADMRTRIERIAGERSALLRDIEKRFPAYANLISPKPPSLADARLALRADEALVATYSAEDVTYLWATRRDGELAFAKVAVSRRDLQAKILRVLDGVKVTSPDADSLPKFDVVLAHEMYKLLLGPIAKGWTNTRSLLVVPHGPVALLPFSVLPIAAATEVNARAEPLFADYRKVPWLAREAAVTQFPSVNTLVTLRSQPAGKPGRLPFAGFGDPIFSAKRVAPSGASAVQTTRGGALAVRNVPQTAGLVSVRLGNLPRLPETAEEILAIAQVLGTATNDGVFLGHRANEKEVKTGQLAERRIVAFATHGLVAGDLDGLTQPALALTAPELAGVDGDGLLTMEEVLGLKLDADWVILSACNTAAGEGAGAEAISGLGRAFFYAGSRSLLVSNWPVETISARDLTTATIARYAKGATGRAESLRQAMLELLDRGIANGADGKPAYSYAHPLFWAPFSVIGDGG